MGPRTVLKLMVYSKISFKLFWVMNHTNQARAPPLPPAGASRLAPGRASRRHGAVRSRPGKPALKQPARGTRRVRLVRGEGRGVSA